MLIKRYLTPAKLVKLKNSKNQQKQIFKKNHESSKNPATKIQVIIERDLGDNNRDKINSNV